MKQDAHSKDESEIPEGQRMVILSSSMMFRCPTAPAVPYI